MKVASADEDLWRGQRRLAELLYCEMPSSYLSSASAHHDWSRNDGDDDDDGDDNTQGVEGERRRGRKSSSAVVEAFYRSPPAVELLPFGTVAALRSNRAEEMLVLGAMKEY